MTPTIAQPALPADWRDLVALTKPRVMSLVVFTGLAACLRRRSAAAGAGLHRDPVHRARRRRRRRAQPMV